MAHSYDFKERLVGLRKNSSKLIKFNFVHAPHYTLHGVEHSEAMEDYLDSFLLSNNLKLNDYEDFLLRAAIWLHDIGMMKKESVAEDINEVRKNHHMRSKGLIDSDWGRAKFSLSNFESGIIGYLAFFHRKSVDIRKLCEYYKDCKTKIIYKKKGGSNENFEICVDKLAMILRLLDTCDRCYMRSFDQDVITMSQIPEAAKYHWAHLLINSVDFDKNKIIINSTVPPLTDDHQSSTEENLIIDLVINDIKKEIDSLEWALIKYKLYPFDVEHIPNRIGSSLVPKIILDDYLISRNTFTASEPPNYFLRSLDKNICVYRNGHVIDDMINDLIVTGEAGIKSIKHAFYSDVEDGNPDSFRFRNFDLAKETPITDRFNKQSIFAHHINDYEDKSINIKLREESMVIGDPFKYREFYVDFPKELTKGTCLKYGIGISSPNYFVLDNPSKPLFETQFIKVPTTVFTFNLKLERGVSIKELNLEILSQNNISLLSKKLDISNANIYPYVLFDNIKGKCLYSRENGLYYDTHRFIINNVQTNRLIGTKFKVGQVD